MTDRRCSLASCRCCFRAPLSLSASDFCLGLTILEQSFDTPFQSGKTRWVLFYSHSSVELAVADHMTIVVGIHKEFNSVV